VCRRRVQGWCRWASFDVCWRHGRPGRCHHDRAASGAGPGSCAGTAPGRPRAEAGHGPATGIGLQTPKVAPVAPTGCRACSPDMGAPLAQHRAEGCGGQDDPGARVPPVRPLSGPTVTTGELALGMRVPLDLAGDRQSPHLGPAYLRAIGRGARRRTAMVGGTVWYGDARAGRRLNGSVDHWRNAPRRQADRCAPGRNAPRRQADRCAAARLACRRPAIGRRPGRPCRMGAARGPGPGDARGRRSRLGRGGPTVRGRSSLVTGVCAVGLDQRYSPGRPIRAQGDRPSPRRAWLIWAKSAWPAGSCGRHGLPRRVPAPMGAGRRRGARDVEEEQPWAGFYRVGPDRRRAILMPRGADNAKTPPLLGRASSFRGAPATTYSPRGSRPKYHRRWRA
jgi:hypothetical protein